MHKHEQAVKLCTCQIRKCAGEGEHMIASGRLVVWRRIEGVRRCASRPTKVHG